MCLDDELNCEPVQLTKGEKGDKGDKGDTGPAATLNYKIYRALVRQELTSAPTAVILENTLGGTPVFSRNGIGDYSIVLTGAFTNNKTFYRCNGITGQGNTFLTEVVDVNTLRISTFYWDGADDEYDDNLLYDSPLEIIVYN